MFQLIVKLVFAHLLGDFVLQSNKMVVDIKHKGIRSKWLYIHVLIYFFLLLIVTGFKKEYYLGVFILSISHLLVDIYTKTVLSKQLNGIKVLLLDQMLHMIAIALFVYTYQPYSIDWSILLETKLILFCSALIIQIFVAPILIKKTIELFKYKLPNNGLSNAGKYIGILERLFIFLFIVLQRWEGIGFLLAAKSIFRFGDLKENKDLKLTEYILIGTLLSFGLGIITSLLYIYLSTIR